MSLDLIILRTSCDANLMKTGVLMIGVTLCCLQAFAQPLPPFHTYAWVDITGDAQGFWTVGDRAFIAGHTLPAEPPNPIPPFDSALGFAVAGMPMRQDIFVPDFILSADRTLLFPEGPF